MHSSTSRKIRFTEETFSCTSKMWSSICLALTILISLAAGELCQEPGLALVADGLPVKHLKLTEATEVMLLGEGECDVKVSFLMVGGGGGYFGAGGGSGRIWESLVQWPAGWQ